jgi:GNAT superfamily N-acetyltransferase
VNGGELLMLALATCYCNDVYREASSAGVPVEAVEVEAQADFEGIGLAATNVTYRARVVSPASSADVEALLRQTDAVAEVQNTVRAGVQIALRPWDGATVDSAVLAIRPATRADVAAITRCVCMAYLRYIERVGKQPAPMLQDYADVIGTSQVHVAERDGRVLGVLELRVTDEGFLVDSVAVDLSAQGTGVGRALLEFAESEAMRHGYDSIYLMTHEKMTENQALYAHIGYGLYDRREVHGYARVLMRKSLAPGPC